MNNRYSQVNIGNGVMLNLIPDSKYKTVEIRFYIHQELNKNSTKAALLPLVMKRGCEGFETQKDLEIYLDELYGSAFEVGITKKGERHIIQFSMSTAGKEYISDGTILAKSLQLLHRILYKPLIEDSGFRREYVEQEKENLSKIIRSLLNDKAEYAAERCFQEMCKNERFSRYVYGNEEDLKNIDPMNLLEYYKEVLSTAPIDIFIIGDFEEEEAERLVKNIFDLEREKLYLIPGEIVKKATGETKEIIEEMDVLQGKLAMGFRTNTAYSDPLYFPLVVYSSILGGGAHSKSFLNVREKASLAYYVYARLEKFKGLMLLGAGIEPESYDKVLQIIQQQLTDIKNGNISEYEFKGAKSSIITSFLSAMDSPDQIAEFYLGNRIKNVDLSVSDFVEKIQDVTMEQVIEVAQRIKLDTIYFLRNTVPRKQKKGSVRVGKRY